MAFNLAEIISPIATPKDDCKCETVVVTLPAPELKSSNYHFESKSENDGVIVPPIPTYMGCFGEGIFLLAEIVTILVFAAYTKYDDGVHPSTQDQGDNCGLA